jgi:hypothetical protein
LNSLARRLAAWACLYNRLPELPWNYRLFHQLLTSARCVCRKEAAQIFLEYSQLGDMLWDILIFLVKLYNVQVSVYSARLNSLARRLAAWARLYNRLPELPWNYRPFHQLLMTWLDSRLMIGWNSASIDQFDHWFWDFLGAQLPFSVNTWILIRLFVNPKRLRFGFGWNLASIDQFDHWFWDFLGAQLPFQSIFESWLKFLGQNRSQNYWLDRILIVGSWNYLCPIDVTSMNTSLVQMLSLLKVH